MSHYDTQADAEKLDAKRAAADLSNSRADVPQEYQRNEGIKRENMKEITLDWLKSQSPCQDGYEWSIKTLKKSMSVKDFIGALMAENRFNWANWVIVRVMDKPQKVSYAVYAAEQVIDIFEKKYPNDRRPRTAIESAKMWIANPCEKTKAATASDYASATAAYASASSTAAYASATSVASAYAAYAAYASYASAYASSSDDVSDASSSVTATTAAAMAAVAYGDDDIRKQIRIKIINYGLSLLGTGEK